MWEIRNFSSRDQYNCCWWWRVLAYVEFSLLAEEQRRRPRIPPAQPHSSRRCTTFVSPKFVVNCETFLLLQKFLNMGVNQSKGSVDITSTPNKGPAPEVNGKKADEKIIDEKTKVRFLVFFCTGWPNKSSKKGSWKHDGFALHFHEKKLRKIFCRNNSWNYNGFALFKLETLQFLEKISKM